MIDKYIINRHDGDIIFAIKDGYDLSTVAQIDGYGALTLEESMILKESVVAPEAPPTGYKKLYAGDDDKLYVIDSLGNETEVGSGSGTGSGVTINELDEDKTIAATETLNQSYLYIPTGRTLTVDGYFVGAEPNIEGDLIINGESIILGNASGTLPASATQEGYVTTTQQQFSGEKEFLDQAKFTGGFDTSDDAGLATSTAAGLVSLSNDFAASATDIGFMNTIGQTFAGAKIFSSTVNVQGILTAFLARTGQISYSSGSLTVFTVPSFAIYLVYSEPQNYGGTDNRHGTFALVRRPGASTPTVVSLAAAFGGFGVFSISGNDLIYGSTGGGVPSTTIYWLRLA